MSYQDLLYPDKWQDHFKSVVLILSLDHRVNLKQWWHCSKICELDVSNN